MNGERRRYALAFGLLAVLLVALAAWNLNAGTLSLSVSQVAAILMGQDTNETAYRVLWDLRLPRVLGAVLLGGALSVSGFLLQTFFNNPIASPFVRASPPGPSSPWP